MRRGFQCWSVLIIGLCALWASTGRTAEATVAYQVSLRAGWSSISFPIELPGGFAASDLVAAAAVQGVSIDVLSTYVGSNWSTYHPATGLNNFPIELGQGYVVYSPSGGAFWLNGEVPHTALPTVTPTPEGSVTPSPTSSDCAAQDTHEPDNLCGSGPIFGISRCGDSVARYFCSESDEDWAALELPQGRRYRLDITAQASDTNLTFELFSSTCHVLPERSLTRRTPFSVESWLVPGSYRFRVRPAGGVSGLSSRYEVRLSCMTLDTPTPQPTFTPTPTPTEPPPILLPLTQCSTRMIGGGAADTISGMARDASGNLYVVGVTSSSSLLGTINPGKRGGFLAKLNPGLAVEWVRLLGGIEDDEAYAVAVNSAGIYVAGSSASALTDGTQPYGGSDVYLARYDSSGARIWARLFGGTGADAAHGIALLSGGDVVVVGATNSPQFEGQGTSGGYDLFVMRVSSTGVRAWSQVRGGASVEQATCVAIAAGDVIYVGGSTEGSSFEGQASSGKRDGLLFKLDAAGALGWARLLGGDDQDVVAALLTQGTQVLVAGNTRSSSFAGRPTAGNGDAFLVRYDSAGSRTFAEVLGGNGNDAAYALATEPAGRVYLAGGTGSSSFNGFTQRETLDTFIVEYTADLTRRGTLRLGYGGSEWLQALLALSEVELLCAGNTTAGSVGGQVSFGGQDGFVARFCEGSVPTPLPGPHCLTILFEFEPVQAVGVESDFVLLGTVNAAQFGGQPTGGGTDLALARVDMDTLPVWQRVLGGSGNETARDAVLGPDGTLYVLGSSTSPSVGGQPGAGGQDVLVAAYSAEGTLLWSRLFGGSGDDLGMSLAVSDQRLLVVGETTSPTLGGQALTGTSDAFMARLDLAGNLLGVRLLGGDGPDALYRVSAVADGYWAVGASNSSQIFSSTGNLGWDGLLATFDGNLVMLTGQLIGTEQDDRFADLTVADANRVILLASTELDYPNQPDSREIALIEIGTDRVLRNATVLTNAGEDTALRLGLSSSGNPVVLGTTTAPSFFGRPGYGGRDLFLCEATLTGSVVQTQRYGGAEDEELLGGVYQSTFGAFFLGRTMSRPYGGQNPVTLPAGFLTNFCQD